VNDQNLQALHSKLPEMGIDTTNYEDFKVRMSYPENRELFWNTASPLTDNLGTLEEFENLLADQTPLDRPPVEIPYEQPDNQQDSITLEQPIDEERVSAVMGKEGIATDTAKQAEFLAEQREIKPITEDTPEASRFNTFFDQAISQPLWSFMAGQQVATAGIFDALDQFAQYGERITGGKIKRGGLFGDLAKLYMANYEEAKKKGIQTEGIKESFVKEVGKALYEGTGMFAIDLPAIAAFGQWGLPIYSGILVVQKLLKKMYSMESLLII